ncbi:MAG: hypothetical protein WDN00_13405 [Limisphaerales bacterium]
MRARVGVISGRNEMAPFSLVHKVVELADDFFAALGREQFKRFERRTVVFAKTIAPGGCAPFIKKYIGGRRHSKHHYAGAVRDKSRENRAIVPCQQDKKKLQ